MTNLKNIFILFAFALSTALSMEASSVLRESIFLFLGLLAMPGSIQGNYYPSLGMFAIVAALYVWFREGVKVFFAYLSNVPPA